MSNQVITKACTIQHLPSTMEKLKAGDVLVNPTAQLLTEVTTAGGTYRAGATPNTSAAERERLGEAFGFCSNASP